MSWKLYAALAFLGLAGGGGLLAVFRRDQQQLGAGRERERQAAEDGRRKDDAIEILKGQRDNGVHDAAAADRVWDALRRRR